MVTFTVFLFLVFNKLQARNVWHVHIGNDYVRACLVIITSTLWQDLQWAYGGVGKSKYFISAIIEDFRQQPADRLVILYEYYPQLKVWVHLTPHLLVMDGKPTVFLSESKASRKGQLRLANGVTGEEVKSFLSHQRK